MYITIIDKAVRLSKRSQHPAGYLVVKDNSLARSGMLQYRAGDIGAPGNPNRIVNVYRPPEEVKKIIDHYANMPLTLTHPVEREVTLENARGLMVGSIGSNVTTRSIQGGEIEIVADLIITDGQSIKAVEDGEYEELSAGYRAKYSFTKGTAPDGTPYEAIQHSLVPNHVALVSQGRCGSGCKVADDKQKQGDSEVKTIKINGQTFTVTADLFDAMVADGATIENGQVVDGQPEKDKQVVKPSADEEAKKAEKEAEDAALEEMKKKKEEEEAGKEKAASDHGLFQITLEDGTKGVCDENVLKVLSANKKTVDESSKKAVDVMEMAKLTSNATRILGNSFDINACDSVSGIKKSIVKSVMPVVDESSMENETALETLYKAAVDTFNQNSDTFQKDVKALSVDGAKAISPVAGLMANFGMAAPVADQKADVFNPAGKKITFLGDKKEG